MTLVMHQNNPAPRAHHGQPRAFPRETNYCRAANVKILHFKLNPRNVYDHVFLHQLRCPHCKIAEHDVSHIPPTSWRPDCNAGNLVAAPQEIRADRDERTIPIIATDCAFLDRTDENTIPRT